MDNNENIRNINNEDGTISLELYSSNINDNSNNRVVSDTTIFKDDSFTYGGSYHSLIVGTDSDYTARALLKFNLPEIPTGYRITGAYLQLVSNPNITEVLPNNDRKICVHALTQDWEENTATWANMNDKFEDKIYDYFIGNNTSQDSSTETTVMTSTANITELVTEWYNGKSNHGLMLKWDRETEVEDRITAHFLSKDSVEYTQNESAIPTLVINLKKFNGVESYLSYTEQSHHLGSSYINNYTGNLTTTYKVGNTVGGLLPVTLSLVYNTSDILENIDYGYGLGIKPNLIQLLEEIDENKIKYIDETGSIHYFYKNEENEYTDVDGLSLTITKVSNDYIMNDKDNNKNKYVIHGTIYYLEEIKSTDDKTITINYDSNNRITSVIDSCNNSIKLTYESNKITIVSPYYTCEVNLTNNRITSITSLGDTETIEYNTKGLITKITNPSGLKIAYEYQDDISPKVSKVSELSKQNNVGNYLTFKYNLSDTKVTDNKGRFNTYIFNKNGNVIGTTRIDEDGNLKNAFGKSYSFGESGGSTNKLISDRSLVKYINNLFTDSSFELENDGFISNNSNISKSYSNDSLSGLKALKITSSNLDSNNTASFIYKDISVDKEKYYTFSLYTKNEIPFDIELSYDNEKEIVSIEDTNDEYKRYNVTINYPSSAISDLKISVIPKGIGEILIDDIQLEEGKIANYYNLITNSDFSNGTNEWDISLTDNAGLESNIVQINNNNALKLHSSPLGSIVVDKEINISGQAGDTFNLSFWYKTDSIIPTGYIGLAGGIFTSIFFDYGDDYLDGTGIPEEYLNVGSNNWQFLSTNFTAEADYQKIYVRILSDSNVNDCYLTNFSLFKDLESYSYVYDDNGNLVSSSSLNKEKTEMEYDKNNQLLSTLSPLGSKYNYEYDNNITNRIISGVSPTGISNKVFYDSNSNPIKTKISNTNQFSEIDNDKLYYLRAKGTNKYLFVNSDKRVRVRENECSYDKFYIIKDNDTIKLKHAVLNNYYIKVIDNEIILSYGDNNNEFTLVSNQDNSYSIVTNSKALTINDNLLLSLSDFESGNYNQEFFFEDSSNKLYIESTATYTEDGRFIKSVKDSVGNTSSYEVNESNGLVNTITDPNDNTTNYTYDSKLRVTNINSGNHSVSYEYSTDNNLSKITHGTKNYLFEYDEYNNPFKVKINNNTLVTNTYEENNGNLTQVKYGNNHEINYTYDSLDRLEKVIKSNDTYTNYYDNLGRITKVTSNNDTYKYNYDFAKRLSTFKYNNYETNYDYDKENNVIKKLEELSNSKYTYNYEYNEESALTKLSANNDEYNYNYDVLGRLESNNINNVYNTFYKYISSGNKTSTMISEVNDNGTIYHYTYDKLGNITEISKDNILTNKYYYDEHSQLIKDDNLITNETTEYEYDNYGNILSKKIYTYNTDTLLRQNTYEYNDSNWQDLLTKFNNEAITYDTIGNPIIIGTKQLTWMNGRELSRYQDNNLDIEYKYNLEGIRTSKVINGTETIYYLEGKKIIFEDRNGNMIYYIYNKDELLGFIYNGIKYYYHKNMFGDIIGILDSDYQEIVTYSYDSYGKITSIIDNSNINLGTINPFRYRSYYYDEETSLYYLNSRYYNPVTCRFINADSGIYRKEAINNNIMNYCGGNPITRKENGNNWIQDISNKVSELKNSLIKNGKNQIDSVVKGTKDLTDSISKKITNFKNKIKFEWGTGCGIGTSFSGEHSYTFGSGKIGDEEYTYRRDNYSSGAFGVSITSTNGDDEDKNLFIFPWNIFNEDVETEINMIDSYGVGPFTITKDGTIMIRFSFYYVVGSEFTIGYKFGDGE